MKDRMDTHLWADHEAREMIVEGKPQRLYRCSLCRREFAREADQGSWRAVRVGTFQVESLADSLSEKWISEPCPGRSAEGERKD